MKILAVSDRVLQHLYRGSVKQHLPKIDLIIGCGDLPYYYLDFLVSALDAPLVYVLGNHDHGPQYTVEGRVLKSVRGGHNIHGRVIEFNGLLLAGLEGSMRYRPEADLMYSETEMRMEIARLVPRLLLNRARYGRALDILVAHSPPHGIHDMPDRPHQGFRSFLPLMRWFKPRFFLHGHIHRYRQDLPYVTVFENSTIINVYPYLLLDPDNPPPPQQ